jgi:hypothetical protein
MRERTMKLLKNAMRRQSRYYNVFGTNGIKQLSDLEILAEEGHLILHMHL